MLPESIAEKLDWDAQETIERVCTKIQRENLMFGATIIIEDLIQNKDSKFLRWLKEQGIKPASALEEIAKAEYTEVGTGIPPGQPSAAGMYILKKCEEAMWITNVELGQFALLGLAKFSASGLRTLLFGKENDIEWRISMLGRVVSQFSVAKPSWRDYFANDPSIAIRETLCHISQPRWSDINGAWKGDVVWFGQPKSFLNDQALWTLWYLYQSLEREHPFVSRAELVNYLRLNLPHVTSIRPDKQGALYEDPMVKHEGTSYWLNIPNIT